MRLNSTLRSTVAFPTLFENTRQEQCVARNFHPSGKLSHVHTLPIPASELAKLDVHHLS